MKIGNTFIRLRRASGKGVRVLSVQVDRPGVLVSLDINVRAPVTSLSPAELGEALMSHLAEGDDWGRWVLEGPR